jgi:hypothetical protein
VVAVVQRQDSGGHARWVLAVFVERGRQDQVLTGRHLFGGDDVLLDDADEVVGVAQSAVLDIES